MKKIALTVASLLAFGISTGFAAPINNLSQGQTAVGVVDDSFYLEHKMSDNLTLGFQKNDIYGQVNVNNNIRAIIGSRDYNSNSKIYVGAAVTSPLAPSLDGYASLVGASGFKELQVGANYNLTNNLDLNVNYRSFMPDEGSNSNRTALGATFKF
ncbi:hypothetical protein [Pelosinus sp. IPA-1]|uniref:hypothetical protein n=1 Tax=Pelosinus sp. IPA-1 TaxID=3029569 RepID=UPI00243624F4|nr:hypothetical protein [Pelosinus sp. IPA-1]GMA99844.1 hypothetical protein PIPA1_26440 [Pelosinus sp. IPA-1]